MNENTFVSQRTHVRVKFEPLTVSCHLACLTPDSPCAQSVNTLSAPVAYDPNRELTPTVIFPDVRAADPDNVFQHGAVNKYLSIDTGKLQWLVDGKAIADEWDSAWYEIDTTDGDTRGTLKVKHNFPASTRVTVRFKGVFTDWRTGATYAVESDEMPLSTTDKGADAVSCSVDKPNIVYDPVYDNLLLYDYKTARGLAVTGTRADNTDGKGYEQVENVVLTSGLESLSALPDGVTMRVVRLGTDTALTPNSEDSPELLSATFPTVRFDMRMISQGQYEVQFVRDGKTIARAAIGLTTVCTMPSSAQPLRQADITPSMDVFQNRCLVNIADTGRNGVAAACPELYWSILWLTQAKVYADSAWKYADRKEWQYGERIEAPIADLGIGVTQNDSFFDTFFNIDPHPARQLVTDGTDVLTDGDGEYLID